MVTRVNVEADVADYRRRLDELHDSVRTWFTSVEPAARFSEREIELEEQLAGRYAAKVLAVDCGPGARWQFIPRGAYMVGARGRVDVRGPLGTGILVWVEEGGPALAFREVTRGHVEESRGRHIFPNVAEGWAWVDNDRRELRHLDRDAFLATVVESLKR